MPPRRHIAARSAPPRPLNAGTLAHHARRVAVPRYDRAALAPGVVHISVGSFHRAHQAVYFDDLAQLGIEDWGVTGVGLHRPEMRAALTAQDGLYTVVARGGGGDAARVVGVMTRYLFAPEEAAAVLEALTDERARLVTLTITAAGYHVDATTGAFVGHEPALARDLADPAHPRTALGCLVEALDRRRRRGDLPFTVLSCDNMPSNGVAARTAVTGLAAMRDPGLARWIDDNVAFPSSMVDRITPKTSLEDRAMVARRFGIADEWPVVTEPFSQWIIEDDFSNARPPLDAVGARFVTDVRPYALAKTRLLNAGHSALGYLGSLAGHVRADEAVRDPVFAAYLERMMADEVAPLLPPVPGLDLDDYREQLMERFANPAIGDRLSRLCRNGSVKVPGHLLSSIRDARMTGRAHALLTLAVAAWCRYLRGVDDRGEAVAVEDPRAERLTRLARAGGTDPSALLTDRATFGDLGDDRAFAAALGRDLRALESRGARALVEARVAVGELVAA